MQFRGVYRSSIGKSVCDVSRTVEMVRLRPAGRVYVAGMVQASARPLSADEPGITSANSTLPAGATWRRTPSANSETRCERVNWWREICQNVMPATEVLPRWKRFESGQRLTTQHHGLRQEQPAHDTSLRPQTARSRPARRAPRSSRPNRGCFTITRFSSTATRSGSISSARSRSSTVWPRLMVVLSPLTMISMRHAWLTPCFQPIIVKFRALSLRKSHACLTRLHGSVFPCPAAGPHRDGGWRRAC